MGKYSKKKSKKSRIKGILLLVLAAILLICALLLAWGLENTKPTDPAEAAPATTETTAQSAPEETFPAEAEQLESAGIYLNKGLTLLETGKYTGIFMEDGSDEPVSNVLMLIVQNAGEQDIQYAEITIPTAQGDAKFTLSTLPVGEKAVLLEQNRMPWSAEEDYSNVTAQNVALFQEPLSLREDVLKFQVMDGVINITNVSGGDITGDIVVYYKNAAADLLYGGITYRVRLEGGLKADEIRQIMASHYSKSGSRIMFATVG